MVFEAEVTSKDTTSGIPCDCCSLHIKLLVAGVQQTSHFEGKMKINQVKNGE
jgi:hypothetical protein